MLELKEEEAFQPAFAVAGSFMQGSVQTLGNAPGLEKWDADESAGAGRGSRKACISGFSCSSPSGLFNIRATQTAAGNSAEGGLKQTNARTLRNSG